MSRQDEFGRRLGCVRRRLQSRHGPLNQHAAVAYILANKKLLVFVHAVCVNTIEEDNISGCRNSLIHLRKSL